MVRARLDREVAEAEEEGGNEGGEEEEEEQRTQPSHTPKIQHIMLVLLSLLLRWYRGVSVPFQHLVKPAAGSGATLPRKWGHRTTEHH